MSALIEFRDVCKHYKMGGETIAAADHISFFVERGEFCVIVGPSGAGKTTVLNMLGGMDACDEGRILLDGTLSDIQRGGESIDQALAEMYHELDL